MLSMPPSPELSPELKKSLSLFCSSVIRLVEDWYPDRDTSELSEDAKLLRALAFIGLQPVEALLFLLLARINHLDNFAQKLLSEVLQEVRAFSQAFDN